MRKVRLTLAAAAAVAAVAAPAASADNVIIENLRKGCYGVGVVVCNPHVTQFPVGLDSTSVPVCVRTCTAVDVPVPAGNGEGLCVAWSDQNGSTTELCGI